jgi:catechol 2,3-dioxygenase-like lactoylglutathione lyase family enzyme
MPRFHHVNLGVPPGVEEAEGRFLVDVLGYRKVDVPPDLVGRARWYEADDGSQVHLSLDPEHRPAARAHTAIEIDDRAAVQARLEAAGTEHTADSFRGVHVVLCTDPAGNRWELRS